ncbi:LysR family transcriptional regulator substrate-binding protein [Corynebacterium sp. UBA2622]|uniref:LysR family transcriptional regulator substrate-binding protein n=1 Tax=Corynebacterium sp. UBA2622 TaxID=1946393 RepID=UPI0025BFD3BA|nr:LysR family transcriptional regulator substrate-binding protein [Corynebacterium sp. UBA2622]
MLRLSFVTGSEPGKWLRRYEAATAHGLQARGSDDPLADLAAGECDLALARLPDERVGPAHHVVSLYDETPGVAVPKDSVYAEVGEDVRAGDVAGEIVNFRFTPGASIDELRAALQVVAANVGVAFAPAPLLKVLSKKQVVTLALVGGDAPRTSVALVWRREADSDAIQDFVGVAKGRTSNSSRGSAGEGKTRVGSTAKAARKSGAPGRTGQAGKPRRPGGKRGNSGKTGSRGAGRRRSR